MHFSQTFNAARFSEKSKWRIYIHHTSKVAFKAVKDHGESRGPWGPWTFDSQLGQQLQHGRHPHPRQLRAQALRISTGKTLELTSRD